MDSDADSVGARRGSGVARGQHAELVALGIGENHAARVFSLTDVHPARAQLFEPPYLSRVVVVGSGRKVEVKTVLDRLAFRHRYEGQPRASLLDWDGRTLGERVWGYEDDLIRQINGYFPAEYRRPPL